MKAAPDLLDEYLSCEQTTAFSWSESDCILFMAGWVKRVNGVDFGAPWRGLYRSKDESKALLESLGGLVPLIVECLGPPRMGSRPVRGDVGVLQSDDWTFCMIFDGDFWAMRDHPIGVRTLRIGVDCVWSVGVSR
ncbi:hypothetical protein NKJ09_22690 [Mesorhizobium sp. M0189]|uniref:DUF6950 family protein n=1 Tax=Mesorhizobium sp. M0189 TaxID=2956909 RepID=UPI003339C0DF